MPLIMPPNEAPRSLRSRRSNPGSVKHSPDGYFTHDEIMRTWRPNLEVVNNRRSRTYNELDQWKLQDVAEEEDASDPHPWRPPSKTDSRGPCPALGALSNHGYLPRDGRNISMWQMVQGIREGYGGSWTYALVITIVSYVILRLGGVGKGWLWPTIDLEDLAAHGVLEHDGSLAHADVDEEEPPILQDYFLWQPGWSPSSQTTAASLPQTAPSPKNFLHSLPSRAVEAIASRLPVVSRFVSPRAHIYAPSRPSSRLIDELLAESASGTHFTLADAARARVRREATTPPIPSRIIQQFADGEYAMTIDILGHDGRVELDVLRVWLKEERLPRGWTPSHVQTIWRTHMATGKVQALMAGLRAYRRRGQHVHNMHSVVSE